MGIINNIKGTDSRREEMVQCSVCQEYFRISEGFQCPKCRRPQLCKKHRLPGKRECVSCVIDMKLHELTNLRGQEQSIQNFNRFLQFVFLVFAVFFIALKVGVGEEIGWLKNNIFAENLIYIGIGAVIVYMISYLIMINQRKRNDMVASEIEKIGTKRY